jgi:hypothetical protein
VQRRVGYVALGYAAACVAFDPATHRRRWAL